MPLLPRLFTRDDSADNADRARLLYDDHHNVYGTWGGNAVPPPDHGISAEEERRLQSAWDGITQWAGNQIVEIFPSAQQQQHPPALSQAHMTQSNMYDSDAEETRSQRSDGAQMNGAHVQTLEQQHQDILLSMIPGDKSKRSIRIYPASRPNSRSTENTNGIEGKKLREKASGVFGKMDLGTA
ncbi:uncharacterized protein AB675_949 [Cyphellophora attinorum]|uniref:Uncharacterized protein n=1 Tax=Cyphellophora attinorum TaxID=1664694 RepID=A0A0N1P3U4_9EURO|nr:uncharacterized protein AB675_949 [Phialophora attinorum]KPI45825.1 hypothetical protein AB675_949 [Phialophora attinorum]